MPIKIPLTHILFLDIETVSQQIDFSQLDTRWQALWEKKARFMAEKEAVSADVLYNQRAAISAEFGKIVCISVGFIFEKNKERCFRLKSFYGHDEKEILENFTHLLTSTATSVSEYLCAHNGKEFDFPYIARRMLINGLCLPQQLQIAGKKPWEIMHLDTLELWKFGDYKNYTSLDLLTAAFDIPSPKQDISGADVGSVYWIEKDLPRIVTYCQHDVLAIAQLYLRYQTEPLIKEDCIEIVE